MGRNVNEVFLLNSVKENIFVKTIFSKKNLYVFLIYIGFTLGVEMVRGISWKVLSSDTQSEDSKEMARISRIHGGFRGRYEPQLSIPLLFKYSRYGDRSHLNLIVDIQADAKPIETVLTSLVQVSESGEHHSLLAGQGELIERVWKENENHTHTNAPFYSFFEVDNLTLIEGESEIQIVGFVKTDIGEKIVFSGNWDVSSKKVFRVSTGWLRILTPILPHD
ncbi:hypothetical protein [Thalassoglobus polymorphus]|uniref:Uncharacterized protein n=1 Tax=Thalassoglobus polymorphus TaxID=2527994 RepID=A0A517QIN1_9PLAN|nr:hypothetical protein [Thalassoglobus polymorphus]QDT31468.1 hypothetical protein Mal48_07010 [Thalassoglobus polymorphus]